MGAPGNGRQFAEVGLMMGMVGPSVQGDGGVRRCSFCGRREDAVGRLVRARGVFICDGCVARAQDAIAQAPSGTESKVVRMRPPRARPADPDVAEQAIEQAFETVFDTDVPATQRCAAIERGGNLVAAMEQLALRYPVDNVDLVVDSIRFLDDDEAEVRFTLHLGAGRSQLSRTGHARRVDAAWKMARDTWCGLVAMAGVQCPAPDPDD